MMIRTLSAVAIVTATLSGPVFAQHEATPHKSIHALRHYRGTYNQVQEPAFVAPSAPATGPNFDGRGFDRSWIGDRDPSYSPPGT
jgi:hypothetical protein